MWFEILPSFLICAVALSLPNYGLYLLHKGILGNPYKRTMLERWDRAMYQRDERLGGTPYNVLGLDSIPDKK